MAFPYESTPATILGVREISDFDEGGESKIAARIDPDLDFEGPVGLVITDENGLDVRISLQLDQAARLRDALAKAIELDDSE